MRSSQKNRSTRRTPRVNPFALPEKTQSSSRNQICSNVESHAKSTLRKESPSSERGSRWEGETTLSSLSPSAARHNVSPSRELSPNRSRNATRGLSRITRPVHVRASLVHLTEIKGDRNSDGEINRLSARPGKRRGRERERPGEYTGSRDQQCPHSSLVHTGALLNSAAFRDR